MDPNSACHSPHYEAQLRFDELVGPSPVISRRFLTACSVIFLFAISIDLIGLSYELPFIYHPDEPTNLSVVHDMIRNHSLNPRFFNYPSLMFYLHLPAQQLINYLYGTLLPFEMQTMGNGWTPQPAAFIAARLTSTMFGAAVAVAAMLIGRDLRTTFPTILLVGFLVVLNPLVVFNSRLITPDIPATLFVTLAILFSVRIAQGGGLTSYLAAGAMAGLAASTKYNTGLVVVAIVAAHVVQHGIVISRARALAVSLAASAAAFLFTSPFLLLDFPNAAHGFLAEVRHYRYGHPGYGGDTLRTNLLWLAMLFGLLLLFSPISAIGRFRRSLIPIFLFVLIYLLFISLQVVRFERNLLPVVPALCILIAVGMTWVVNEGTKQLGRRQMFSVVLVACSILLYIPTLSRTWSETLSRLRDPRAHARAWLQNELRAGTTVLTEPYAPYLDLKEFNPVSLGALVLDLPIDNLTTQDVLIISSDGSGRFLSNRSSYQVHTFEQIKARACRAEELTNPDGTIAFWIFFFRC